MTKEIETKKTKETKVIPFKNYAIVVIIFILTIGLAFFLRNWYISYQDYEKTIPILSGVISEINYNEVQSYIGDNQSVIIYMGVANDEDCREVEPKLKKLIEEKHLKDKIVYFNITDVDDKDLLLKEFNEKYSTNEKITAYPVIMLIEDGKIVDFAGKNANDNLLIEDIEILFDEHNVYGD